MRELTRLTEGRCMLIAYARDSLRGNEHTANVLTPAGLCPPEYLQCCSAYGLWRTGLYLQETHGLKHYSGHKNYDPVALKEDLLSLATVLGQGLSLLTHLDEGGTVEAWEPLALERARQQFQTAHMVVKLFEALVNKEHSKAGISHEPKHSNRQSTNSVTIQRRSNNMGKDKSLTNQHPAILIEGTLYHYGREPEFGQYLVEDVSVAKNYSCFKHREDLLAYLVNLPESVDIIDRRALHPDWREVTPEQRGLYMEQDAAYLRKLMEGKKELKEWYSKQIEAEPQQAVSATQSNSETERKTSMADNEPNGKREPIYKLTSDGSPRAAIWLNKNQTTQEEYFTASFYRSYRDKQGQWQTSTSFRAQDLPGLMQLAEKAHNLIQNELSSLQGQAQQSEPHQTPNAEPEIDL
jgi:hypothetical protein